MDLFINVIEWRRGDEAVSRYENCYGKFALNNLCQQIFYLSLANRVTENDEPGID